MKQSTLNSMRCPFCWGSFTSSRAQVNADTLRFGLLHCYCGVYPVVAAIPILQKQPQSVLSRIIAQIESGEFTQALELAVSPLAIAPPQSPGLAPPWAKALPSIKGFNRVKHLLHTKRLRRWHGESAALLRKNGQCSVMMLNEFYFQDQKEAFNYFAFRFGQPRHLVALSLATIIHQPRGAILDLACGQGHLTRYLLRRSAGETVIGIDPNFLGLYVAKTIIAPEAEYICAATDGPMPFPKDCFAAAFCSDAFHYFTNKAGTFRELRRLVRKDGVIILTWVHNALFRLPHDGFPLPYQGYEDLTEGMPHRLVGDEDVLIRYRTKQGPALAKETPPDRLAQAPLLSLVASFREDVFKDYGFFDEWPHAQGRLQVNPLYRVKKESGRPLRLKLTFPSDFYAGDHRQYRSYLPEEVDVEESLLGAVAEGARTPQMEQLISQCVLLDIPEKYL